MKVIRLDMPIKRRRIRVGSMALEEKLLQQENKWLDREIPPPSGKIRLFTFGAFNK